MKAPKGKYSTEQRFDRYVSRGPNCWGWTGNLSQSGYGRFALNRWITVRAHRYSWERVSGPVPDGLCVLHRCDNPKCVRPDHLFLGTHKDNAVDRERKARGAGLKRRGEAHPLAKLSADDVRYIRASEERPVDLAEKFGITDSQIWSIRSRATWKHL